MAGRTLRQQSPNQCLDIYLPDEVEGPFPVIAVIHGGAFMMGNKGDVQQLPMLEGLKRGYAVVCIEYRLSGGSDLPGADLRLEGCHPIYPGERAKVRV